MTAASHMYASTKTWSPFKGCNFDCTYCIPSFQAQAKRQKQNCRQCYEYEPHEHPERLLKIPGADIIFACASSDISFCAPTFFRRIIDAISTKPDRTFYLQSKKSACFKPFLKLLPKNVILVTTLETNRDEGYDKFSKAPPPSERYQQFRDLDYPRKVVTIEPVMDFDVDVFSRWIVSLTPEYVWLGFNSRRKQVELSEPSEKKLKQLARVLVQHKIPVKGKELRGFRLPGVLTQELSRRRDSSPQMVSEGNRMAKQAGSNSSAIAVIQPEVVDQKLVDDSVMWIRRKVEETLNRGLREVGEYVLDKFFHGDAELVRSKNPFKNASFRELAGWCDTPDLPLSKTGLQRAVGIAMMIRLLPQVQQHSSNLGHRTK
jgi:uncharacterized Fe-S cluster-containing radical SAM superfamily protein